MSIMHMIGAVAGGAKNSGNVTVSGEVIVADHEENAQIRFNTDGTVDKRINGSTFVQIDAANDWLRPAGGRTDLYSLRWTNAVGDVSEFSGPSVEDAWISLAASRLYTLFTPGAGPGASLLDVDFEIRNDLTSVTEDSALYDLTATTSG